MLPVQTKMIRKGVASSGLSAAEFMPSFWCTCVVIHSCKFVKQLHRLNVRGAGDATPRATLATSESGRRGGRVRSSALFTGVADAERRRRRSASSCGCCSAVREEVEVQAQIVRTLVTGRPGYRGGLRPSARYAERPRELGVALERAARSIDAACGAVRAGLARLKGSNRWPGGGAARRSREAAGAEVRDTRDERPEPGRRKPRRVGRRHRPWSAPTRSSPRRRRCGCFTSAALGWQARLTRIRGLTVAPAPAWSPRDPGLDVLARQWRSMRWKPRPPAGRRVERRR